MLALQCARGRNCRPGMVLIPGSLWLPCFHFFLNAGTQGWADRGYKLNESQFQSKLAANSEQQGGQMFSDMARTEVRRRLLQAGSCTSSEIAKAASGDYSVSAGCVRCLMPCNSKSGKEKQACGLACAPQPVTQAPVAAAGKLPAWGALCSVLRTSIMSTMHGVGASAFLPTSGNIEL